MPDSSDIQSFFNGRSVFITGATGHVGGILLETLMRCCPGLINIFILVRVKNGENPEMKSKRMYEKIIFETLKKQNPDVFLKVKPISGDISQDGLGLDDSDLRALKESVSIVFNNAANVSFLRPASYMILHNAGGTQNIINFCRKLPYLEALVHTSTMASNCNREEIKEEIYRFNISAKKFIEESKILSPELLSADSRSGSEEGIKALEDQLSLKWSNKYAFSKAISENIIAEDAEDLPTAIVRISGVTCCTKGPYIGYTECSFTGNSMLQLVMMGILRSLFGRPEMIAPIIPGDVAANTLIASAWAVATKKMAAPLIVNCCSSQISPHSLSDVIEAACLAAYHVPLPFLIQTPKCVVTNNYVRHKLTEIIEHYIPGMAMDLRLMVTGRKPKYMRIYNFIANTIKQYEKLGYKEFLLDSENFLQLNKILDKSDKEIFNIDLSGYKFLDSLKNAVVPLEIKGFKRIQPAKSKKIQIDKAKRNTLTLNFVKIIFITIFLLLLTTFTQTLFGFFYRRLEF